jgi:hypothetical protein
MNILSYENGRAYEFKNEKSNKLIINKDIEKYIDSGGDFAGYALSN